MNVQELSSEGGLNPLRTPGADSAEAAGATFALEAPAPVPATAEPHGKVEPLSAESFGLHCTIRRGTFEKLQYVKALLGRGGGVGDLAQVLDRALDALAREIERRKYGIVDRPRARQRGPNPNPRRIPAEVKRAVVTRDQGRCTFVSESGRRCEARERLEFDHEVPVARGGEPTAGNLRLRCRAHNQLEAERAYGAEFMRHKREAAREAAERRKHEREARATAAAEHDRASGETRAQAIAVEEVIPWLRALRIGREQARTAAASACDQLTGAPLEARVKLALGSLARSRPVPAHVQAP